MEQELLQNIMIPKIILTMLRNFRDSSEITVVGQRMHFLLGIRNRLRYIENKKFLSEKYDPHEILIYSTYKNRIIDSVNS